MSSKKNNLSSKLAALRHKKHQELVKKQKAREAATAKHRKVIVLANEIAVANGQI